MNIQIFGRSKCFDTKKAERWFKERRVRFQSVDVVKYGMSRGELSSVKNAVGLEALADPKHPDYPLFQHLAYDQDKLDRLWEDQTMLRTPIVRNGRKATVATSPMCGRTGSNRAVGFSQKNHGQGFALCAALWYTESQQ